MRNDKRLRQSFPPPRQSLSVGVRSNDGQASINVNGASGSTVVGTGPIGGAVANGIGTGASSRVSAALGHHVVLAIDPTFLLAGAGLGWVACRLVPASRYPAA